MIIFIFFQQMCAVSMTKKLITDGQNCYHYTLQIFTCSEQIFFKIGFLKNLANFTGKRLCWSLLLLKLQALETSTRVFSFFLSNTCRYCFYLSKVNNRNNTFALNCFLWSYLKTFSNVSIFDLYFLLGITLQLI